MAIDTSKLTGRRTLKFNSLDDIIADVEKLNQSKIRAIGNWSPGQVLEHVTIVMDYCLDGTPFTSPWYVRVLSFFFKKRFLTKPMPAGFALPEHAAKHLLPKETSWEDGLAHFRKAMDRMKTIAERKRSPFMGELTREEWDMLHCRHCELHLSFLVPEQA